MLVALVAAAALTLPARAQGPAVPAVPASAAVPAVSADAAPVLPAAPQPGVALTPEQRQQQAAEDLRRAVFRYEPRMVLPSYEEFQRQREQDELAPVGHRVITEEEQRALDARAREQMSGNDRLPPSSAQGWKEHSVQLTFARPLPGIEAGVGMTERREWIGNYRSPNQRSAFAFIRIPLGKPVEPDAPKLFLPEARVEDTTHAGSERTTVDNYSIRDLPPGLIP